MSTIFQNPDLATPLEALRAADHIAVKAVGFRHLVDFHRSRRLDPSPPDNR